MGNGTVYDQQLAKKEKIKWIDWNDNEEYRHYNETETFKVELY